MARPGLAVALVVALATVCGAAAFHRSDTRDSATHEIAAAAAGLPRPEPPAFSVGRPVRLRRGRTTARFAAVNRPVAARTRPSVESAAVAGLTAETPEGTTNVVLVLGETQGPSGEWVHVRLPVLPNNLTAWVPRAALSGYHFVHTRLLVDRARFRATLSRDGRVVFTAPVGVGRPDSPTPSGRFYVRDRVHGFENPFYGPIAFGTSARSAVLTDWPGGGFVGIHGTNEPELIPGRISHGCIRMRNADILRLNRLMPVGTPLTIR
jgi:hypothetical protein